nr:uncharacterized protein LOC117276061 [Nicotiana tomentosiformis]
MTGSAKRWWQDYVRARPTGSPPLTWDKFSHLFFEKFIPFTLSEEYRRQFECLQHAILNPIDRERVRRFIDGITFGIRLQMAKQTGEDISFQWVVEIARRIEMIRGQSREVVSQKMPHYFGGFSGNFLFFRWGEGEGDSGMTSHSSVQAEEMRIGSSGAGLQVDLNNCDGELDRVVFAFAKKYSQLQTSRASLLRCLSRICD